MERGDVARLFGVADADVHHYIETDETVSAVLSGDVSRMWTPDGVFAVNDCPQNRQLRPLPDEWQASGGAVTTDTVHLVAESGPELSLPDQPPAENLAHTPDGEPEDEDEPSGDVPEGTADQVLAWVDGDPDRATAAIEAEQQREKPRSVLLGSLKKIAQ